METRYHNQRRNHSTITQTFITMKRQLIIEIICFLFIALFVYAALMKLTDYQKFTVQLDQSPLLMAFSGWVAWAVPGIELIVAAMLMIKRVQLIGLYASFTLMAMFTVYIVFILTLAPTIPCACGGIIDEKLGWAGHLVFNIGFVLLATAATILMTWQGKKETHTHPNVQYA